MHITNRYYLMVDLEATCSNDAAVPRDEREIIEIGAVVQNARTFEIDSEFQSYVRPVRHPHLTEFCTQLTGITQSDVVRAPVFPEALQAMTSWMSEFDDLLFCSWGEYDRNQFHLDCAFHQVAYPFGSRHLNLKSEFARAIGVRKEMGILSALNRVGISFQGKHHSGLDDARNMARIVRKICTGVA